jgi:hypothetical protein
MRPKVALAVLLVSTALVPTGRSQVFGGVTRAGASAPAGPPQIAGLVRAELAGRTLAAFPRFEFVDSFFEGEAIQCAFDTALEPALVGGSADVYLCEHRDAARWAASPALVDVRGAPTAVTFAAGGVQANTLTLDAGSLSGLNGDVFGRPLDVIADLDRDGRLSSGDRVDGAGERPGLWLLSPSVMQGPHPITEVLYSGGTWLGQDLYYPSDVAALGELPLVVVSHGNGHNYTWYDHIGYHLASWGYVVMSHTNNTQPGPGTASTTTLTNTDYLLANLATIAGGALQGHVDRHRIVWIGHSRGGEGVARAYDRLYDGTYTAAQFTKDDIVLISSIAPTDFGGAGVADPHDVPYSLWTGGADSDVNGCADCNGCQTFHLHERATGPRSSISLHGVGHGAFHNGVNADLYATGPCIVSRGDTHQIMRAYLLALVELYAKGNPAGRECLWRQWEAFQSPGSPQGACITVDLMHRPDAARRAAIDDFQTNPAPDLSSSGGAVAADVQNLAEGVLDDPGSDFTANAAESMNGMTFSGGAADTTRGAVFEWSGTDRSIAFALVPALQDASAWTWLSLRACQATRHALTGAALGDLTFSVRLRDQSGAASVIPIGAYGGGIEEPYQRTQCGGGAGWANEWETIRIRLADFARGGAVDLSRLAAVELLFGPSWGDAQGRLGLDDVEYARD